MSTHPGKRPKTLFQTITAALAGAVYNVKAFGRESLPEGGFLLLPNRLSHVDALVLQLACPRPIRFVVHRSVYETPWLKPIFTLAGAIPISNIRTKEAFCQIVDRIRRGEVVCILPEQDLNRSGTLVRLYKGFEVIAHWSSRPVVPVWLEPLREPIFWFERGDFYARCSDAA